MLMMFTIVLSPFFSRPSEIGFEVFEVILVKDVDVFLFYLGECGIGI